MRCRRAARSSPRAATARLETSARKLQKFVRRQMAIGLPIVPRRRELLHACHVLRFNHPTEIAPALEAATTLRSLGHSANARRYATDLGAIPSTLRTIASCNRSPQSLAVLLAALEALAFLAADGDCLRRGLKGLQSFCTTLLRVCINHWGSPTYFTPAARCLLAASSHDGRLEAAIQATKVLPYKKALGKRLDAVAAARTHLDALPPKRPPLAAISSEREVAKPVEKEAAKKAHVKGEAWEAAHHPAAGCDDRALLLRLKALVIIA